MHPKANNDRLVSQPREIGECQEDEIEEREPENEGVDGRRIDIRADAEEEGEEEDDERGAAAGEVRCEEFV